MNNMLGKDGTGKPMFVILFAGEEPGTPADKAWACRPGHR